MSFSIRKEFALSFDDVLLEPQFSEVLSRKDIDLSVNMCGFTLGLPIISAPMPSVTETEMGIAIASAGGLPIIHRMQSIEEQIAMIVEIERAKVSGPIGAAVGITDDWEERIAALEAYADIICIDVAHGGARRVLDAVKTIRKEYGGRLDLMIGNFASPSDLNEEYDEILLAYRNSTVLRCGVGGGSVCTTRIATGHGTPTFWTGKTFSEYFEGEGPQIVLDGGIRYSSDAVKSLAVGATAVMLGGVLAGTEEAPGPVLKGSDGALVKSYYGAASYRTKKEFSGKLEHIEGVETMVPYKGSVVKIIKEFTDGLASGLSYSGAQNISQLQQKAIFLKVTPSGLRENFPHALWNK